MRFPSYPLTLMPSGNSKFDIPPRWNYKRRPGKKGTSFKGEKMKQNGKINYIEMPSQDISATKAFFITVFGWSFIDYGPDYVAIADAGIDGGFFKSHLIMSTAQGSALVVLYSADLAATLEKVKSAGGTIIQDIFSFPGGSRFHFADPNGNEYAVWSELTESPQKHEND